MARFDNQAYPPIKEEPARHAVRRQTSGRWQCKMSEQSRETAIREIEADIREIPKPLLTSLNEIREAHMIYRARPKWVAIDDEVVGPSKAGTSALSCTTSAWLAERSTLCVQV